jgi:hypothetical protein
MCWIHECVHQAPQTCLPAMLVLYCRIYNTLWARLSTSPLVSWVNSAPLPAASLDPQDALGVLMCPERLAVEHPCICQPASKDAPRKQPLAPHLDPRFAGGAQRTPIAGKCLSGQRYPIHQAPCHIPLPQDSLIALVCLQLPGSHQAPQVSSPHLLGELGTLSPLLVARLGPKMSLTPGHSPLSRASK